MELKDITGQKFGKLKVIKRVENNRTSAQWLCLCDCGNECKVIGNKLRSGWSKSCSCNQKLIVSAKFRKHGLLHTTEYKSWQGMKERCVNINNIGFDNYGGRGISVCEQWINDFNCFISDMGYKPGKNYSLDRIDVNGNYCPENCKWSTFKEQGNNTRRNRFITFMGERLTLSQWSDKLGFSNNYFYTLVKKHKIEDAMIILWKKSEKSKFIAQ